MITPASALCGGAFYRDSGAPRLIKNPAEKASGKVMSWKLSLICHRILFILTRLFTVTGNSQAGIDCFCYNRPKFVKADDGRRRYPDSSGRWWRVSGL